jgi:hypothetical protein
MLLTYRQFIFVLVYSHLLRKGLCSCPFPCFLTVSQVLDHSSQIWWRWTNIFFTLVIWSVELLVSDPLAKDYKVD